ncbi:GDSL esterase/lipase 7-like [Mercurialis annua]|uniref:GDSL esterase/lipase 7-like n=1 Tax=Mercurialis annua TaxID=3986 RepID=UPI0024AF9885|nr:GDSL esterase/lipase 7-like [Mercurialis annua]
MTKMSLLTVLLVLYNMPKFSYGGALAPALYVFGDSLVDSGNNNYLTTIARANYFPYGVNFAQGPAGRFTNGRTIADFFAEYLGLPYPPPCVNLKTSILTPTTGINYASGSCGILFETGKLVGNCLSLDAQIELFEAAISLKLQYLFRSKNELSKYLADSIFLFSVGSNDYIINYLVPYSQSSQNYNPQQFAQLLLNKLSENLQKMYNLGARKMIVFELGPIGCIPYFAKKAAAGKCMEETNKIVGFFNNNLGNMLKKLEAILPGVKFVHGQSYSLCYDANINPQKYGLIDSSNPCCTTWSNGTSSCIPLVTPCPAPNKLYFFDAFHPTESVYSLIASRCINDNSACSPTISQLVKL